MTIPSKLGGTWNLTADNGRPRGFTWIATHSEIERGDNAHGVAMGPAYCAANELEELYTEIEIYESEQLERNALIASEILREEDRRCPAERARDMGVA